MRTFWPMIAFAVMSGGCFAQWHWTGSAHSLWMSGVGAGLFFGAGIIEGIGWLIGQPLWITIKPKDVPCR